MKPLISMSHAAFLLALAAMAAIAWAGHLPPPPASVAAFLAGAGLGMFAAALLLCALHCINRLIEWRADIRDRRTRPQPTNQP